MTASEGPALTERCGRGCGQGVSHRFNNARGRATWRRLHPHPAFSPDGNRLYFNVRADRWVRLLVAECDGRD